MVLDLRMTLDGEIADPAAASANGQPFQSGPNVFSGPAAPYAGRSAAGGAAQAPRGYTDQSQPASVYGAPAYASLPMGSHHAYGAVPSQPHQPQGAMGPMGGANPQGGQGNAMAMQQAGGPGGLMPGAGAPGSPQQHPHMFPSNGGAHGPPNAMGGGGMNGGAMRGGMVQGGNKPSVPLPMEVGSPGAGPHQGFGRPGMPPQLMGGPVMQRYGQAGAAGGRGPGGGALGGYVNPLGPTAGLGPPPSGPYGGPPNVYASPANAGGYAPDAYAMPPPHPEYGGPLGGMGGGDGASAMMAFRQMGLPGGPDPMMGAMDNGGGIPGAMGVGPMGGGMGMGANAVLGPSRAIFVSQVPPGVSYEELFDAVGAFGNLESIKLIPDKRHAFINFIDTSSSFNLMTQMGGEIHLHGQALQMTWARTRPVPRDLYAAIRQGATRNLYVANVPESFSEQSILSLFGRFGDLESIRLVPRKFAAFVNYVSVSCAIRAKEAMHFKHPGPREGNGLVEVAPKPLLINFTSAQQNCMRARGGRHAGWDGNGGNGGGRGRMGERYGYGDRGGGYERGGFERGQYGGRGMGGGRGREGRGLPTELPSRSRALYLGSVPDAASLEELAALIESLAVIESLRLVRPKSCAFINLIDEEVAQALHAKFTTNDGEEAPELRGKKLTVNFAKARPCTDEQIALIANGARRRLRIVARPGFGAEQLKIAVGSKAESVLEIEEKPLAKDEENAGANAPAAAPSEAAGAPAAEDANGTDAAAEGENGSTEAGENGGAAASPTHALEVSFSSVTAAIAAKADLEKSTMPAVCTVVYIMNSVLSDEELKALIEAAQEAEVAASLLREAEAKEKEEENLAMSATMEGLEADLVATMASATLEPASPEPVSLETAALETGEGAAGHAEDAVAAPDV